MFNLIIDNILRNPPVLIGLVSCLGLVLQKKKFPDVIKGTILAAIGMFILQEGVGLLAGAIAPINIAFQGAVGASVGEIEMIRPLPVNMVGQLEWLCYLGL